MSHVVSEGTGAVIILILCIVIALPSLIGDALRRRDNKIRTSLPENEKISAVQLLRNQHDEDLTDWQVLWLAIAYTESRFNPDAVGKANDSGILQLTPVYVDEVNRLYGTDYDIQDAFDIDKALELVALLQAKKNPSKDIDTAIFYHNKSVAYRDAVKKNMELIRRYEAFRKHLNSR